MYIFASVLHKYTSLSAIDKKQRLVVLRDIVATKEVRQQEVLLEELRAAGFVVTQATLSRDLKKLGISKAPDGEGAYRYVIHHHHTTSPNPSNIASGTLSVEVSGQMAVIRTLPGYASVAGTLVDSENINGVMGTIAGDDTLLVILRQGTDTDEAQRTLNRLFF